MNYLNKLQNYHRKQVVANNSNWIFRHNKYFFLLLFQHLITQKWFKSFFISLGAIGILYFRDWILTFYQKNTFSFFMLVWGILFAFEMIKSHLKGKEYYGEETFNLIHAHETAMVTLLKQKAQYNSVIYDYTFLWKFPKDMRVPPTIVIEEIVTKEGVVLNKQTITIGKTTSSTATFDLRLEFNYPTPSIDLGRNLSKLIVKADAHVFSPEDPRAKLLSFFTTVLPNSKFGFFC